MPEVEDLPPLEHRSGFREKLGHERPLGFDWEEKFFLLLYNFVQLLNTTIFLGQHIYLFYWSLLVLAGYLHSSSPSGQNRRSVKIYTPTILYKANILTSDSESRLFTKIHQHRKQVIFVFPLFKKTDMYWRDYTRILINKSSCFTVIHSEGIQTRIRT